MKFVSLAIDDGTFYALTEGGRLFEIEHRRKPDGEVDERGRSLEPLWVESWYSPVRVEQDVDTRSMDDDVENG